MNALWEGRLAVDASAGLTPPATWSHRYRVSVFLRTTRAVTGPSAVIATGPFGDAKNYNGRDLYLSWYPTGLLAEGHGVAPPAPPALGWRASSPTTGSDRPTTGGDPQPRACRQGRTLTQP